MSHFEEVLPIWQDFLWPQRISEILPTHPLGFLGQYQGQAVSGAPTFLCFVNHHNGNEAIVGVVSGFKTSDKLYRCRGLYVFENYRLNGIGRKLLTFLESHAVEAGCNQLWTLARHSAYDFYLDCGFHQDSPWINDKFEFGPNCYMSKSIGTQ